MADKQHATKIEINGFRGLERLELDGLGTFNVLLGANDVGKTSALEAIFLLSNFTDPNWSIAVQNWRNLRVNHFDDLALLFRDLDVDTPIRLTAHSAGSVERQELILSAEQEKMEIDVGTQRMANGGDGRAHGTGSVGSAPAVSASPRVLRYDVAVKPRGGEPEKISNAIRVTDDGAIQFVEPLKPASQQTIWGAGIYVTVTPGYASAIIDNVKIQKRTEDLVRFLQTVNPRITDIIGARDTAYVDTGLRQMIPLNMFGSGMMRATMILSPCILGNEQVLLIDELENGLHHKAILSLLKILLALSRERGMQVFATTHSIGVLESLQEALQEEEFSGQRAATNCYALQRDKDGLVRAYRYGYEQFDHCIRNGLEIR